VFYFKKTRFGLSIWENSETIEYMKIQYPILILTFQSLHLEIEHLTKSDGFNTCKYGDQSSLRFVQ
jgi:hypothetical protein